jgi:hypothetical protein
MFWSCALRRMSACDSMPNRLDPVLDPRPARSVVVLAASVAALGCV